jgi:hypothetical protein
MSDERTERPRPERNETPAERSDRNWSELLQELRVTQTGIQILSGFLLTIPFQSRFEELDPALVVVYLAAVACGTLSTLFVVAPVPLHRLLFRRHVKNLLVDSSDVLARIGLALLAVTVVLVTALVFGFVLGTTSGLVAALAGTLTFLCAWLLLPLLLRSRPRIGEDT